MNLSSLFRITALACATLCVAACPNGATNNDGGTLNDVDGGTNGPQDITDVIFTKSSASCADYAGSYSSTVTDINRDLVFNGEFSISTNASTCDFSSNGIPNHDFNDGNSSFPNPVGAVEQDFSVPLNPSDSTEPTPVSLGFKSAILLNGGIIDVLPAACWGVGNEPLGQEKIGCFTDGYAWRYDPMFPANDFGTDSHNAHSQPPDGKYHYHGNPRALFDEMDPAVASPVIGFAPDGYPLFGSFIDDNGTVREVQSSYELRGGMRSLDDLEGGLQEGAAPGGNYDGTFRDDFVYTEDLGDLDACNGMMVNGQYGYYITNAFPWVPNCFMGTPDSSMTGPNR
ncbi:MAG: YHYH protein [Deltaproteobacteria bacterium]|nr:YHYH protein [Deltaproteobacteria bacterium]